jgi:ABC-2 type transport system ATP-binding protein
LNARTKAGSLRAQDAGPAVFQPGDEEDPLNLRIPVDLKHAAAVASGDKPHSREERMSDITPMLQSLQLTKDFGTLRALSEVDLEIREGEIFGLLGPNGAGKTTFVNIATTYLKPTSGTMRIGGLDVLKQTSEVKNLLGVVPQEISLYDSLSGEENLAFFGGLYGLRGSSLKTKVSEVLDLLGLGERKKGKIENYSGGMKRRINIGAGILHEPRLILMDEPTVGVDPQSRHHIFDVIEGLRQRGATILYTTHYMEEAERLCDRIAIIDHGRVVACGTRKELTALIGEQAVLEIEFRGHADSEALHRALPEAEVRDDRVLIHTADAAAALSSVASKLSGTGIDLTSINIMEPDLEAVFLKLTGHRLRDGETDS